MPSSPYTRRGVLQFCVGAIALLGGCNGTDRPDDDSGPDPGDEVDDIDVIDGVDVHAFRFDADDREVVVEREDDADTHGSRLPYVVEREDVDALELRYDPVGVDEVDGPADPLAALREIDYEEASGFVVQDRVSACYLHAFQYAERREAGDDESGVRAQFCTTKREPDVACSVDDQQVQVTVLELPIAYESRPSGSGRGRRSSCRLPPTIAEDVEGDRE